MQLVLAEYGKVPSRSAPAVANGVVAMVVFIATEVMFFAGLMSAFIIVKAGALAWPPPGQPRLPVAATAFNTAVLLTSGVVLWLAGRAWRRNEAPERVRGLLRRALALGAFFVLLQGFEWTRLIGFGLTMHSSPYGAFFYLIVGAHALHAVAAIVALGVVTACYGRGGVSPGALAATELFWYFVVGVWPVLYVLVYLS
jgi:cytochrome c oxidase subunit 3